MDERTFRWTLNLFELEFVIPAVRSNDLGSLQTLSTLPGKLTTSDFGKYMGLVFPAEELIVIDYYGYWKRSSAFKTKSIEQLAEKGLAGAKTLKGIKVDFAGIKIEQIAARKILELTTQFADMKQQILDKRGFVQDEAIRNRKHGR